VKTSFCEILSFYTIQFLVSFGRFFKKILHKNTTKLHINKEFIVGVILIFLACFNNVTGQKVQRHRDTSIADTRVQADSTIIPDNETHDNITPVPDSASKQDSLAVDSSEIKKTSKKPALEDQIKYSAKDSLIYDLADKRVFLYGDAHITYQDIDLTAGYVVFDMGNQTVTATAGKDSSGKEVGKPVFKQGNEEFEASLLKYNFKSKKGLIDFVVTKQADGYLHSDTSKREANGVINLKWGKYTTCDAPHPHFYIGLTKAKAVPNDKIVTGPAYLVVEDVPLPVAIPFGFFPNTGKSYASGILIPTVGEEQRRGFYLRDGGYYFAINDNIDARVQGAIFTKLSWELRGTTNYKVRYRYSGSFNASYLVNVFGEPNTKEYSKTKQYSIQWSHSQDPKANPNSKFSASVNFSSSKYDQYNGTSIRDYVNNTKNSSISYGYNWTNFYLSTSLNHSQDNYKKTVDLNAPTFTFGLAQPIYPFRRKEMTGEPKWYENIQINYNGQEENRIHTIDTLLFTSKVFDNLNNGFKHSIPLSASFKLASFITLTPSLNYEGYLYTKSYSLNYDPTLQKIDTTVNHKLQYGQSYYPSASLGITPKFYGFYQFKNSKIKALRHVMSPSVTVSMVPDVRDILPNYNRTVFNDKTGKAINYNIFNGPGNLYGAPTGSSGKAGSITMSLNNNFEMKVVSQTDTGVTEKKITLLDNLNFSSNYNIFKDSMRLSTINMNASTNLFSNKLNIQFSAILDPYVFRTIRDSLGRMINYTDINAFEINKYGKLGRITSANITLGTSFQSGEAKKKKTTNPQNLAGNPNDPNNPANRYNHANNAEVDFDIPWSLNVRYNWSYAKQYVKSTVIQTLELDGDLNLTKKWKIGFRSGFDVQQKVITMTDVNINRDLHCWTMSFHWVPFGPYQSYSFTINAKASILHDLKYDKNRSWYDNF
jgi:hypothetical protein